MSWIGLLITSTGRRYLYEPGLNFRQRLMLNIPNKTNLLYLPGSLQELADKLSMFSGIKCPPNATAHSRLKLLGLIDCLTSSSFHWSLILVDPSSI